MKNWEASPMTFVVISVVAGVTTAVVAAALQKWWGLKFAPKIVPTGVFQQPILGKYRAV